MHTRMDESLEREERRWENIAARLAYEKSRASRHNYNIVSRNKTSMRTNWKEIINIIRHQSDPVIQSHELFIRDATAHNFQ